VPDLPARPDLDHLRHQAKDLLRAARTGDDDAIGRISSVSSDMTLTSAQLALAREYGFVSWAKLKREVERRKILDARDLGGLQRLLADDISQATSQMEHWCDHPAGASPLGYLAMLPYDTARGVWRKVTGTGALARALIDAGASINGDPGDSETPLITAASYGDAEVAKVLIDAGADMDRRSSEDSGGVPNGTALLHAAVFGMTEVVDLLVAAGAEIDGIEVAAAAGDVRSFVDRAPLDARIRALVMAASHQRLDVIDQLIASGTPVDAVDEVFGGHPLREAAAQGRPESVKRLLAHGADPTLKDEHGQTALDHARRRRTGTDDTGPYDQVEQILESLTETGSSSRRSRPPMGPVLAVEIRATDFPGASCGPGPKGEMFDGILVGLSRGRETVDFVSGGADGARWLFEVEVRRDDAGRVELRGPFVLGGKDDRHFGLRWVTTSPDGQLEVFRAAKLRIVDIGTELIENATRDNRPLTADLVMTDRQGLPICARVRAPDVLWSVG
jgi:ankyrin repeat protein